MDDQRVDQSFKAPVNVTKGRKRVRSLGVTTLGLLAALGLGLLMPSTAGTAGVDAAATLRNFTKKATAAQSGFSGDADGSAISGQPFRFRKVGKIRRLEKVTTTATIFDGDTGPGDAGEGTLVLLLDGVDTGILLDGFRDGQTDTVTISGAPANARKIVRKLKADGKLEATIRDLFGGNELEVPSNVETTLVLKGKQG